MTSGPFRKVNPHAVRSLLSGVWFCVAAFLVLIAVTAVGVGINALGILALPIVIAGGLAGLIAKGHGFGPARISALVGVVGVLLFGVSALAGDPGFAFGWAVLAVASIAVVALSVSLMDLERRVIDR